MKNEYDFSNSVPNPYTPVERKAVTMRLGVDVISYFKEEAARTGIPYQNLINLYLAQCAREEKHLAFA